MKILVVDDNGKETEYDNVREFALLGLRMDSPMNPSHFTLYSGTTEYLLGQLYVMLEMLRRSKEIPNGHGNG
jgi:hypothetical protein